MSTSESEDSPFVDERLETYGNRILIGFSERDTWVNAPAHFDKHTLTIQNHPVMEDWETPYMEELALIATSIGGTVLEIGFGMGISARHIQKLSVEKHIIIEANEYVYEKLKLFAKDSEKEVVPMFGFWEEITPTLQSGSISGILFDTYPLNEKEIHSNHFPFFEEAYRLLKPEGILTYYSDEIDSYSALHLEALTSAGFTRINKKICNVKPPPGCLYWKSETIVAPIIQK